MDALHWLDGTNEIDVALVDLVMPKGQPNGLSLGRMARVRNSKLIVNYLTAYPDLGKDDPEHGVDRIACSCGFGDEERMRTTFQRHLAISPRDYRRRFSTRSMMAAANELQEFEAS
jgi:AraC-like DNA-binding protein